jgi:hypothetical protein
LRSPAFAQTEAACKQEYAAKKAAGEAGGQSQASYVKACLARQADPRAENQADSRAENIAKHDTEKLSSTDLAKESQNPIGNLYVIPFNNYSTFGFGPNGQSRGTLNVLQIQPVIPIHLNDEWNIITRAVIPLVWTPNLAPVPTVPFGTGPSEVTAFLAPRNDTNGWMWGVGPVVQAPTISSPDLGSSVWGGGPSAVIVYTGGKIVAGVLANTIWSFGGTHGPSGNSYNTSLFEPFFNYNFGDGWAFFSDPNITANWEAKGTKWTVPLGECALVGLRQRAPTATGPGPRLALLLHHDDAEREAAYDREFRLSPLSEALDKAGDYGFTVVSMKRDWKVVF